MEHGKNEHADVRTRAVKYWFPIIHLSDRNLVGRVAFWAEVALFLLSDVCISGVEVHPFICASGMSADSLLGHVGNLGRHPWGFDEPYIGKMDFSH